MEAHPHLDAAREMLTAIGMTKPIYLYDRNQPSSRQLPMSATELAFYTGRPSVLAATSPILDLKLRSNALRYEHNGRGFCCLYWRAVASRTESQVLATTIHEFAHWLADVRLSERDDRDYARAIATWHNRTDRHSHTAHGEHWLRACVAVWQRACDVGYRVAFDDIIDVDQYGVTDQQVNQAIGDAVRWRDKPLGTVELLLALPKESSVPAKSTAPSSTEPMLISGDFECVWQFPDGRVGVPGEAAGSITAFFPSMTAYWQSRGDGRRRSVQRMAS